MAIIPNRVFISYSRKDTLFAAEVHTTFASWGVDVWRDEEDIHFGDAWRRRIDEGLDTSAVMVLILSPDAMDSENVRVEWEYFLDEKRPIIPLLYRACKIPSHLRRLNYIDFQNPSQRLASYRRLHQDLKKKGFELKPLSRPTPEPASVRVSPARPASTNSFTWAMILGGVLLLVFLGGILWQVASSDEEPSQGIVLTFTPLPTKMPITTLTPTWTPTLTLISLPPPATWTPTITPTLPPSSLTSNASEWLDLGYAAAENGDYQEAIDTYTRAIELDPEFAAAYYNRGNVYSDLEDYERAIQDYDRAIELDPDYVAAYQKRGVAYSNLEDYVRAIQDYDRAIELDPDYVVSYVGRGWAYHNLGIYERAIQDYDRAIELDPQYAAAYNNRGNAYSDGLEDYERAIQDYDRAIELDPEFAFPYNNRGIAYWKLGEFEWAIRDYDSAIGLDPEYVNAYKNRGNLHYYLQNYEQALADYRQYEELTGQLESFMVERIAEMEAALAEQDN